ncbi:MAG: porin family protein [Bacteroidota bacterium]
MKTTSKILLTLSFLLTLTIITSAQQNYWGINVGLKASQPSGAAAEEAISPIGAFTIGARFEKGLSKRLSLMTGINLNARGFSFEETTGSASDASSFYFEHRIGYVEVPIALKWQLGSDKIGLQFMGGTNLGFATAVKENVILTQSVEGETEEQLNSEQLNFEELGYQRFNASILLGTGIYIGLGRSQLFCDVTLDTGLTPLIEGEDSSKFVGADFVFGLRLPLGKQ